MRSKAIFVALLAFAFGAQAVPVSSDQASAIARAFVSRGGRFGAVAGTAVEKTERWSTSGGAVFYSVKMVGAGTVITTGDTDQEPVVAFLPGGESLSSLDPKHPLWALLDADLSARQGAVRQLDGASLVYRGAAKLLQSVSVNRDTWKRMISEGAAPLAWAPLLDAAVPPLPSQMSITDLRVGQLLETTWHQSGHGENQFTPKNYVCGCVATAMAQLMRFHCWPTTDVPKFTEANCAVDGVRTAKESLGGVFDWENMPVKGGVTLVEKEAVGKLTYDCGVSVQMDWGRAGSGAVTMYVANALKKRFGYANVAVVDQIGGLDVTDTNLGKILFSSLDAGSPVQLGIRDSKDTASGHSIVGDGYGFVDDVSYVHLNMGWSGDGDAWYHFPDIEYHATSTGWTYTADTIHTCIYNVFPEKTGWVISGRALDEDGEPLEAAEVSVEQDGVEVAHVQTSARGVWAAILPSGTYSVRAVSADGEIFAELESVTLGSANLWGNDLVLSRPAVRVGDVSFATLNRAIVAAREAAETATSPVKIELLEPTRLKVSSTIDFDCVIVSTNDDPYATPVTRVNGATLSVTKGKTALTNVVFRTEASTPVFVLPEGQVTVSGIVVLDDIASGVPGLVAETATGLKLVGRLETGITFDCKAATQDGDRCGLYWCDQEVAEASALLIVSANGVDRACEAREGELFWKDNSPVDPAVAVAYVDGDGDEKTYYRTLERLFDNHASGTNVVVTKSGVRLQKPRTLKGIQFISAAENAGEIVVRPDGEAGFLIGDGCELTVAGMTFEGYKGNGLFVVKGTGAKLTVTNSAFRDIEGTNRWSGAIAVLKGAVRSFDTDFDGCRAVGEYLVRRPNGFVQTGKVSSFGGAIYLAGNGCSLVLNGGKISNCFASGFGGGVYAARGSSVGVLGDLTVKGNGSKNIADAGDDIYLLDASVAFELAGELRGRDAVGVRYGNEPEDGANPRFGNDEGDRFARVAVAEALTNDFCLAFFNDTDSEMRLCAQRTVDGTVTNLLWAVRQPGERYVDADNTNVTVRVTKGADTRHYIEPEYAFDWIGEGDVATVEVLKSAEYGADLIVTNGAVVTLTSTNSEPFTLTRAGSFRVRVLQGASLVATNVVLDGNWSNANVGLVKVESGAFELQAGAVVSNVLGTADRAAGGVSVWNGGVFTMRNGSVIVGCVNDFIHEDSKSGYGGGLLVDESSTANLLGGRIAWCAARRGGGVFIGTKSVVNIAGDVSVEDNFTTWDLTSLDNLCVADLSGLVLTNSFTGSIGYNEGRSGDTNVFGRVDAGHYRAASDPELSKEAARFVHDARGVRGVVATNGTDEALLVWSDAFVKKDGVWTFVRVDPETEEEVTYGALGEIPPPDPDPDPIEIVPPTPVPGLVYNGNEQTGVLASVGFTLTGNVAIEAGNYTAVAKLENGYVWTGGDAGDKHIEWSIAPKEDPPEPEPVECLPFAFTAIVEVENSWTVTISPVVKYCTYTLMTSDDLKVWTAVGGAEEATADGEMSFTRPGGEIRRFWKVVGQDGVKPAE